jgi:peptidoglycan L-alanyl-D-glutamate endopeptidase CwlK
MKLNLRSLRLLDDVHEDLRAVVLHAAELLPEVEPFGFIVTEGLRTTERQRRLLAAGASRTLNSRHLTGHAVDLAVTLDGEVRWDWPLYHRLALLMKTAATDLNVPITWGGDWRTFKDGPHFELSHTGAYA